MGHGDKGWRAAQVDLLFTSREVSLMPPKPAVNRATIAAQARSEFYFFDLKILLFTHAQFKKTCDATQAKKIYPKIG
jgi:hypothetical protein